MNEEALQELADVARERWGEGWTIHTRRFADGSVDAYAARSRGRVDGGSLLEEDRLYLDKNEIHIERVRYKPSERVESRVLESEERAVAP